MRKQSCPLLSIHIHNDSPSIGIKELAVKFDAHAAVEEAENKMKM